MARRRGRPVKLPTPPKPPPQHTGAPFDFRPVLGTGPFISGSDKWRGEPLRDPENLFTRLGYHFDDDILGTGMGAYRGVVTPEFLMRQTTGPIPQQSALVRRIRDYLDETRIPLQQIQEESGELAPPRHGSGGGWTDATGTFRSAREYYPKGGKRPHEPWWDQFDQAEAAHRERVTGRYPLGIRRRGK